MERSSDPGLVEAALIDLRELHISWMSLVFPRQREGRHAVLGAWRPRTLTGRTWYAFWSAVGVVAIALVYPLALVGFGVRFYVTRVDRVAASLGVLGVVFVSVLAWGGLTAATYYSRTPFEGFVAVGAAGVVATLSAALAMVFSRLGGRASTVLLAYPFGMTALFLPPVVAALYSPTVAEIVFPRSELLAIWLLDNVLDYGGIAAAIRATFELEGLAYVGMWFGLAVPVGWFVGFIVTLANVIRPRDESAGTARAG